MFRRLIFFIFIYFVFFSIFFNLFNYFSQLSVLVELKKIKKEKKKKTNFEIYNEHIKSLIGIKYAKIEINRLCRLLVLSKQIEIIKLTK